MCGGGPSEKFIATAIGIFCSIAITAFLVYELILLVDDGEQWCIYGILFFWLASKLFAFAKALSIKCSLNSILYQLILSIIQSEWYSFFNDDEDDEEDQSIRYLLIQMIVNGMPINLINIYLLSDTTKNINNGYYIAVIFIHQALIGIFILVVQVSSHQEIEDFTPYLQNISSIFTNFSFYYLLIQSFLYNPAIGASIVIFNSIAFILDCQFNKQPSLKPNEKKQKQRILNGLLQYFFQINTCCYSIFTKNCNNFQLKEWSEIAQLSLQCLNIVILTVIKLTAFPLIIELDKAFYAFLALSLPLYYTLCVNIYYKLTKTNKYHYSTVWKNGILILENKVYSLIEDRFATDYQIEIQVDYSCTFPQNKENFYQSLNVLNRFLFKARNQIDHPVTIIILSPNRQFLIELKYGHRYVPFIEGITLSEQWMDNQQLLQLFQYITPISFCQKNNKKYIYSQSKSEDLNFQVAIQSFQKPKYQTMNHTIKQERGQVKSILQQIRSHHFSALLFYKQVSFYLTINPNLVFYDLHLNS